MTADTEQPIAKRAPEVRYYYLSDVGTQWQTKIARIVIETTYQKQRKGPDLRNEIIVKEDLIDIPTGISNTPFLRNVFGRQEIPWIKLSGNTWGGWSLSPAEYARIKRMVELSAAVAEYEKLARYE